MQSFESAISNVITSLENAVIDEVYLQYTIGKICKTKIPKNIDEKQLTPKNRMELLKGRQWIVNSFDKGKFLMKTASFIDYNDDCHYFYDDDLYPKKMQHHRLLQLHK